MNLHYRLESFRKQVDLAASVFFKHYRRLHQVRVDTLIQLNRTVTIAIKFSAIAMPAEATENCIYSE